MRIETLWKYSEEGRVYHSLEHIATMMRLAVSHKLKLNDAQKIAIVHHDTVYRFNRDDNEDMSARLMYLEEKGNYPDKVLNTAYKIILSTARHEPLCKDACDVIDLDLCGLSCKHSYQHMLQQVRAEYTRVIGLDGWIAGRRKWLTHMIGKKKIYHGFWKSKAHDETVKNLMREELKSLSEWDAWYENKLTVPNADGVVVEEDEL
jgi:predicted metal-dependent HD superfamily phosphohydrolase